MPHTVLGRKIRDSVITVLLQDLPDPCLIADASGVVTYVNHAARQLFRSTLEPVGRQVFEVMVDHRLVEVATRAARDGETVERSIALMMRNSEDKETLRHLVINAAPIELPGQKGVSLRIVIRDDTERQEIEQIRRDFVANASHELRTPLSIINGYLENLIDGVIDDPAMVRKSLITMEKHSSRLTRIVEDMLMISRFESAGNDAATGLNVSPFDLRSCVEDVIDRLQSVIDAQKARIVIDFPPVGQTELVGDPFYWEQVFFNLIENALKENRRPALEVRVGMKRSEAGIQLWVADNGVGIPRADLPFVFKRFYRVAKHHNSEVKGTGLGLSIVRRAVEAHGGTISVDSVPGKSTVFTMTLPNGTPLLLDHAGLSPMSPQPA